VDAEAYRYSFWLLGRTGPRTSCSAAREALYLSSEVAGGFTGVYLGLFADGSGEAEVSWFELAEDAAG
jgi:hypothetical protein